MSPSMKIVLILFGLAYLISPVDLIPDLLLPWVGWIDDSLILWSIYYLIRYGELPWFLFKKKAGKKFPGSPAGPGPGPGSRSNHTDENNHTRTNREGRKSGTEKSNSTGKNNEGTQRSAHEVLGIHKNASWTEIQSAYREKIKQYHPDRLAHLGKEFTDLANEKFLEIQTAYEKLKDKHRS